MLGKLLKYEIRSTTRTFPLLYFAILLFALINRLISPFENVGNSIVVSIDTFGFFNIIQMVSGLAYFGLVVAVIALTFIIMIQRFYKNILGDEGYLMFTLPVKPWQLIISKLLVSLLWIVLSFITIVSSILILLNIDNLFGQLKQALDTARTFLGDGLLILIPIIALLLSAYFIMTVYNALSIGHTFQKQKILASFGAYGVIYVIKQIVSSILALLFFRRFAVLSEPSMITPSQITTLLISVASIYALLGIANFIVANYVLNKKLNLE